eukprot:gene14386-biopygen4182
MSVRRKHDSDPIVSGPSAFSEGNSGTSAFISNVPLSPRISLEGNLAENWKQWNQIYDANQTVTNSTSQTDNFRVAAFITCIGPEALPKHNSLPYQEEGERQNIEKTLYYGKLTVLEKTDVIYERYKFNNRTQEPTESIGTSAASWRTLAATCAFGPFNDELTELFVEFIIMPCDVANPKKQTEYTVRFVIVKGHYVPLLGANPAQNMGLLTVNYANTFNAKVDDVSSYSIASSSTRQQEQPTVVMETVLSATAGAPLSNADIENSFGDVFEGLDHMPGKLHLDVDESQTPVVMPPRRVPIALQVKL